MAGGLHGQLGVAACGLELDGCRTMRKALSVRRQDYQQDRQQDGRRDDHLE
jgi:hypothetical protein